MAEKTLLQLTQEFCGRQGIPVPSGVIASTDDTVVQIRSLLNEGISDMADRYEWQQLIDRFTFNHANTAGYVAVNFASSCPGFKSFISRTLWDTTNRFELAGPYTGPEWEYITTFGVTGARYNYRLENNKLLIYPVPSPTNSVLFAFRWLSRYGVMSGSSAVENYTTDSDTPRLPTYIILQDLLWRWKQSKGLPYAEAQRQCEQMIVNAVAREPQGPIVLDALAGEPLSRPGIYIPAGSWPL